MVIEYEVLPDGTVGEIVIVESNVSPRWNRNIYKTLKKWRFNTSGARPAYKTWRFVISYELD